MFKVFSTYCEPCGLKVKLLTGGDSVVGEDGLVKKCGNGTVLQLWDILVVTPGRLTHTIRSCPSLDLSHLRYLVIDEADRMMENIAQVCGVTLHVFLSSVLFLSFNLGLAEFVGERSVHSRPPKTIALLDGGQHDGLGEPSSAETALLRHPQPRPGAA